MKKIIFYLAIRRTKSDVKDFITIVNLVSVNINLIWTTQRNQCNNSPIYLAMGLENVAT
jgi:hypothetical protein